MASKQEVTLKIKIENTHSIHSLALVTGSWDEAEVDQTIEGSRWENEGSNFAYAVIRNTPGLSERLSVEGYEVDDGEFSPVFSESEGEQLCSSME